MVQLEVVSILNENYILESDRKVYQFRLKFSGIEKPVEIGDKICFHKELLDENYIEYSSSYTFGEMDKPFGRKVTGVNDIDVIVVKQGDREIILKRFFG